MINLNVGTKSNKGDKMRNFIFEFEQEKALEFGLKLNKFLSVSNADIPKHLQYK